MGVLRRRRRLAVGVWKTIRAAFEAGEEVRADEVFAQAGPWGLEAFARGYAGARGLTLEDPDLFRHQLASPIGGKPLRVLGGDLGGGVFGHVALWHDWVAQHALAGGRRPGAGGRASPPCRAVPGERRRATCSSSAARSSEAQRSAAELDALIAEARRASVAPAASAAVAATWSVAAAVPPPPSPPRVAAAGVVARCRLAA